MVWREQSERYRAVGGYGLLQIPEGPGLPFKHLPERGGRDTDQQPRAPPDGLAVEVGDPVLGDHVADVVAGRGHARALLQHGYEARRLAAQGGAGEGDDRHAARRARGAVDEVQLTPHPAVEARADAVGAHLPRQIDLDGGVDRHHLRVLGDDKRVVDVVRGVELDHRVVVDEVVQPLRAQHEAGYDLPRVQRLALAGDDALVDQIDDPVAEQLGMDPQVFVVHEARQHCVGDGADPGLQCGAVGNEAGDVVGDALDHRVRPAHADLRQRVVHGDDVVDLADLDEAVEARREVGAPLVHRRPDVVADEQRVDAQMRLHARRDILGRPHGQHLDDLDVVQFAG